MSFVYGVEWFRFRFRNHLPYFTELTTPTYDLWNEVLKDKKPKTTLVASKIKMKDLGGWKNGAWESFQIIKTALVEALQTSFYDPDM